MCKIVTFTNASKLDVKKTSEAIGNILLKLERDGYGYAIQGAQNVFGERCISSRFKSRLDSANVVKLPIVEQRQATFGYIDKPIGAALFHGRTSTNDKGLINCHPMARDNWHLIHNGVVDDNGPKYDKLTTNDSEDLLHRLTLGIEHVERELTGYFAFTAISPDGRLHVARDSIATLYMAWCPKIQSYLIATTESLLEDVAKALKIKTGPIDKIKDNVYMIFEGNELVFSREIKPRGYDTRQSRLAELSLGRSLGGQVYDMTSRYDERDSILDAISETTEDGTSFADLMRELDSLDESYTILDLDGNEITVDEYYKLDEISQANCYIERSDGSVVPNSELYSS